MSTEKTLLDEVALTVMASILSNETRFQEVIKGIDYSKSIYAHIAEISYIAAKRFLEVKQKTEK